MVRPEVRQWLKDNRETIVQQVYQKAQSLTGVGPLRRTAAGCLKVLGDHFKGITKDELMVAIMVVQLQCALLKKPKANS